MGTRDTRTHAAAPQGTGRTFFNEC